MTLILGLESSCDDSAAALVASDRQILAQAIVGQNEAHRPFGGVVPKSPPAPMSRSCPA